MNKAIIALHDFVLGLLVGLQAEYEVNEGIIFGNWKEYIVSWFALYSCKNSLS
ncbi:hypothetical protein SBF1_200004 [Candidatus Desulfosporosinus infrequens]|uniref:Uncharacterized protein n=1 Tax=Candidatus Desulfosporosinus infrequens TaxID=2043169 RepID=A0A2U3KHH8_9FIRM|nr:hypothetical protein SBF1_200004 [Candidatus Desulfosporosinus infrequens]